MPKFEYDEEKSRSNRAKHGIDFDEAQRLWGDSNLVKGRARTQSEPRHLFIGRIDEKHWSAIVTYRNDTIRIISVRRSRANEVEFYESRRLR